MSDTVIVRRVSDDHAVAVGPAHAVQALGAVEAALPRAMVKALQGVGVAGPALSALHGAPAGDLVRLTPHAKTLLAQHGTVLGGDGAVLGVVQGADGRFAGVLSFEPASTVAQFGPALPLLLAAMAVQAQLMVIERKLDDIQADVGAIIRDGQIEVLAEAHAALEILDGVHGDLIHTGELTDADWERIVPLELAIRTLHQQAGAHLRDIDRLLAATDAGLGARLKTLRSAGRHHRAGFWLEAYVVAETALTRWEFLRLVRLAATDDPKLLREVEEVDAALHRRQRFLRDLARRLGAYLEDAGKVDGLLQRMRIIARARLEQLILDLDSMLAAYRDLTPDPDDARVEEPPALGEGAAALPAPDADRAWSSLVEQVRGHSGTVAHRAGVVVGKGRSLGVRAVRNLGAAAGGVIDRFKDEEASPDAPDRSGTASPDDPDPDG